MTPLLLQDTPVQARRRFIAGVTQLVGASNVRALYVPSPTEGPTSVDGAVNTRVWTHGNTPTGRLSRLGQGYTLGFNGTSDYITTPDATDVSFGDGATDTAFTILALVNIVDTAAQRTILSKYTGAAQEYIAEIATDDKLYLSTGDQSAAAVPFRGSSVAITAGVWQLLASTYDGSGGATNMNGTTLYRNGAVEASAPTNAAGYVAMENGTAALEIGSHSAHTAGFFNGSLAFAMLIQRNVSAAQHIALRDQVQTYFGVRL